MLVNSQCTRVPHSRTGRSWLVCSALGLGISLGLLGSGAAQVSSSYKFSLEQVPEPIETFARVSMLIDNSTGQPVEAWNFGVCHDPLALSFDNASLGAVGSVVNGGMPPDFFASMGSATGVAVVTIVDFLGIDSLGIGSDQELHVLRYFVIDDAPTLLEFCDTQGVPPTATTVVVNGVQFFPLQFGVVLNAVPIESFARGDCNSDGNQNLADVVYLLGNLFPSDSNNDGIPDPNPLDCMDACDGNDDGQINLGDPITVLGALFGNPTIPLPAPYPGCGVDPTNDSLNCPVSPCP